MGRWSLLLQRQWRLASKAGGIRHGLFGEHCMDSHGWPWASPRNQEPGAFLLSALGSYWGHLLSRALVGLWSRAWLKGASWRTCPTQQRMASSSPNQCMPHDDVWYPGTSCLGKAGSSPPRLWSPHMATRTGHNEQQLILLMSGVSPHCSHFIWNSNSSNQENNDPNALFQMSFFFVKELISLLWYWITF